MNHPFSDLGIAEAIVRAVADMGYDTPTPVQAKSIPALLQGRDVLAAAQTGTGKTAAFSLPILTQMLAQPRARAPKSVRALVLAPTRELAAQIDENIRAYSRHTTVKTALVFGGVSIRPQTAQLTAGVDFLVATPGRLLDHVGQKTVDLAHVDYLILDEADRMLDMGFIHDIRKILTLVPKKRQTLLFSATFSDEIRRLADGLLNDPVRVEIARNKESTLITQQAWSIAKKRKRELLRDLIVDNAWDQVLVFTRMKHTANRLASQLEKDGINAAAIHGNKSQSARTKALAGFKERQVRVLVATDIAARGLDIEGLPHVVNYELPNVPEDYVHRIGRTGRAGVPGHAVSLVSEDELDHLKAIEKLLKKPIELKKAEGYDGEVPEDIARDEEARDKARAEELKRLRESRRKARNKLAAKKAPKQTAVAHDVHEAVAVAVSKDPDDRFEKKIERTRPARSVAPNGERPQPARRPAAIVSRPKNPSRTDAAPRRARRTNESAWSPYDEARQTLSIPQRMPQEDGRRQPRFSRDEYGFGHDGNAYARRSNTIKSTIRRSNPEKKYGQNRRADSRFESVSSNLPPGMMAKLRRR